MSETVVTVDMEISRDLSPDYDLLLFQFEAASEFNEYCINRHIRLAKREEWVPPKYREINNSVKPFRANHERKDDISYGLMQGVSKLVAANIFRYIPRSPDSPLLREPITKIRLNAGKPLVQQKIDGSPAYYETGTIKFRTERVKQFRDQYALGDKLMPVQVGNSLVVAKNPGDEPEGMEVKHWILMREGDQLLVRVIFGLPGESVKAFPRES